MFDHQEPLTQEDGGDGGFGLSPVGLSSGLGELEDLSYSLSMLGKVDWSACHHDIQLDALADLQVLRNRFDGVFAELCGRVESSPAARNAGHANVAGFLRSECRVPKEAANRSTSLARRLRARESLEPVLESLLAGRIGVDQAALIAQYSVKREVDWCFDDAVLDVFLPIAEAKTFAFFKRACAEWFEHHDESQGDSRDRKQDAQQKVRVSTSFEGAVRVDGWLPTLDGEIVSNEFERLRRLLYDQDFAKAKDRLGRNPKPDELGRTADERSVAVLVLMAQRSAGASSASLPCVNVMIDYETFVAASNELVGLPALYPAGGVCRTEMGLPISPRVAMETLLSGHIRRVVFGPDGQVLDFGRKSRFFTGGLREAVQLRDQTCTVEGCDVPARFCEIDHCQSWNDLGETNVYNANANCRFHNGVKGDRSVEPILNTQTGMLAFHQDPNTKDFRERRSAARKRRPSRSPSPDRNSVDSLAQTERNQR